MSLRKLTESIHLQVSPQRCTHQSIETGRCLVMMAKDHPQGHRRLRFSSPLNNVKEQNPSPSRGQNRASNTPERPLSGSPGSEAPRRQSHKNRAADEDVLSEPLPKVNTFFEVFSRNRRRPNALFQYPAKLQHSQKRIRFCVYLLQSDIIDPETFSFSSEEP